jgi:hypothetical protein
MHRQDIPQYREGDVVWLNIENLNSQHRPTNKKNRQPASPLTGAEPESKCSSGRTPLSWAAYWGAKAVAKLLLDKGADLEDEGNCGRTPLSLAAGNLNRALPLGQQAMGTKQSLSCCSKKAQTCLKYTDTPTLGYDLMKRLCGHEGPLLRLFEYADRPSIICWYGWRRAADEFEVPKQ